MNRTPRAILITGASSGIGRALALDYAAPGRFLALTGRDGDRLDEVATSCRAKGAEVEAKIICVTARTDMATWILGLDESRHFDLVIANAGISAGSGAATGETEEQARAIFAVNVEGVKNTILPVLPAMRQRCAGQVAIMSSLAGFRGLPGAPAYCASKAAVRVWGEGLRGWLAPEGIAVSVICPGFVESRITARNAFPMPFLMSAEKASGVIRKGLAANKGRIVFPLRLYAGIWLFTALPPGLTDAVAAYLPRKG